MTRTAATRRHMPTSPFKAPAEPPTPEVFTVGDLVTDDQHGLGRIIGVEGETAVMVDFGSRQLRIPTPFSKLSKL
ncbi:hypothetical protein [Streptacidiphilus cavernicola]|uniref:ATP-binding protein n=1 Tax=Streptacidiphilus cavernicola TaxID=3342716 RepID=A0ABV6VXY4_9ACTN